MSDSVVVDAKRILLRYGAPIAILDKVSESHRIEFAREIAKTLLPNRQPRLRELLAEHGYADPEMFKRKGRGRAKAAPPKDDATNGTAAGSKAKKSSAKASKAKGGKARASVTKPTKGRSRGSSKSKSKGASAKAGEPKGSKKKGSKKKGSKKKSSKKK